MAKSRTTNGDVPTIGLEARISERGLLLNIKSRYFSAKDRLLGSRADKDSVIAEGQALISQAQSKAIAEVISAAGKTFANVVKNDPRLAAAILAGSAEKLFQEYTNINRTLDECEKSLIEMEASSDDGHAPDVDVSDDFLAQMRQYAGMASSSDMQSMLGRILAGELRMPGSISKRSIRLMFELEQGDVRFFEDIVKYKSAHGRDICLPEDFVKHNFQKLLMMQQAGLISDVGGDIGFDLTPVGKELKSHVRNGDLVLIFEYREQKGFQLLPLRIKIIPLTLFGEEIASILPRPDPKWFIDSIIERLSDNFDISRVVKAKIFMDESEEKLADQQEVFVSAKRQ